MASLALVGLFFGIIMAVVSNAFIQTVRLITEWRHDSDLLLLPFGSGTVSLLPLVTLLIAACLILIVRRLFHITKFHGPADAIYAAHRSDNDLDVKAGLGSTFVAFLSAGGGASVGQYGPLVHFGATLGSFVRRHIKLHITTDVFIGCGVAGAIAAGFNAPIAAIIFAHEVILRHFSLRTIAPIAIASISSAGFSNWAFGSSKLFYIEAAPVPLWLLLPAALLLGPIFGCLATLYLHLVRATQHYAANMHLSNAQKLFFAAFIMGTVGMFVPALIGFGTGEIPQILSDAFTIELLVVLIIGKILLTALCYGFGFFGGVFSPALFVGAAAGSMAQKLILLMGFSIPAPALIISGMAAVGSAVIGAPISGVLIMLELTTSYEYTVAAMLSVVLSALVSYHFFGASFFDRQLLDRGIDISQGRSHLQVMETNIHPLVSQDYVKFTSPDLVGGAIGQMARMGTSEAYILGEGKQFIGKVSLHDLLNAPTDASLIGHMMDAPLEIKQDASLLQAIELASNFVGEHIPVIDEANGKLVGVLTEAALFQAYLNLQTHIVDLEKR